MNDLLKYSKIKPALFYFRKVTPILTPIPNEIFSYEDFPIDQEEASIEFEFLDPEDLENFKKCMTPHVSDAVFSQGIKNDGTTPFATISLGQQTKSDQINRIHAIFNLIRSKFARTGINEALHDLKDPDFPVQENQSIIPKTQNWVLDHYRYYTVRQNSISEQLFTPGKPLVEIPVDPKEYADWLKSPNSQVGLQAKKYKQNFPES